MHKAALIENCLNLNTNPDNFTLEPTLLSVITLSEGHPLGGVSHLTLSPCEGQGDRHGRSSVETGNYAPEVLSIKLVMSFIPKVLSYSSTGTEKTDCCVYPRLRFIRWGRRMKRQRKRGWLQLINIWQRKEAFGMYPIHEKALSVMAVFFFFHSSLAYIFTQSPVKSHY